MVPLYPPALTVGSESNATGIPDGEISFSVTGYEGFEEEILRMRNSNRPVRQDRKYLDWRYESGANAAEPRIFWAVSASGKRIGMASLICRSYWVDDNLQPFAVLGDISLEVEARGKGLGKRLLAFVTNYVKTQMPNVNLAFVIPNEAAQKSLATVGWTTVGRFVSYVFFVDCTELLAKRIPYSNLAKLLARIIAKPFALLPALHIRSEFTMDVVSEIEESLDDVWAGFPKQKLIMRDMANDSMRWRYASHPNIEFKVAKFLKATRLHGYVIFAVALQEKTCHIYDLIALDKKRLHCMLALFLRYCAQAKGVSCVRLLLNDSHPYRKWLWTLGFVPRGTHGEFQVYSGNSRLPGEFSGWRLTMGDKDI
jgi:GNAT superfamily N-acetyltransferase